jgi:hypothetical protein
MRCLEVVCVNEAPVWYGQSALEGSVPASANPGLASQRHIASSGLPRRRLHCWMRIDLRSPERVCACPAAASRPSRSAARAAEHPRTSLNLTSAAARWASGDLSGWCCHTSFLNASLTCRAWPGTEAAGFDDRARARVTAGSPPPLLPPPRAAAHLLVGRRGREPQDGVRRGGRHRLSSYLVLRAVLVSGRGGVKSVWMPK